MAEVARETGAPVVHVRDAMARAESLLSFDHLYFPDRHPSAAACEIVARLAHAELAAAKIAPGPAAGDALADLPVESRPGAAIEVSGSTLAELCVRFKTDPGRSVHFFLSFTAGTADVVGHRIPIGRVAGADGIARLQLAPVLGADAKSGQLLHCAAAVLGRDGAPGLHEITPAAAFAIP
jgi:hypothetical protein